MNTEKDLTCLLAIFSKLQKILVSTINKCDRVDMLCFDVSVNLAKTLGEKKKVD